MTRSRTVKTKKITEAERERAEVVWLRSTETRGRGRADDLVTVLEALNVLRALEGGLSAVAERYGPSLEMVRSFAAVGKLCPEVRQMCRDKRITSVDVAVRLSSLSAEEQRIVAEQYVSGALRSKDVRDVVALRRSMPEMGIDRAIELVKDSRDIKRYLIKIPAKAVSDTTVHDKFAAIVGDNSIVSVSERSGVLTLTVTEEGAKYLQAKARERGVTKRQLVEHLIRGT